jgi:hypothetical protein
MVKPYSFDPTSNGDIQAQVMRLWYDQHRETWRDRFFRWRHLDGSDNFMLEMLDYARRVNACEIPLPDSMTGEGE